LQDAVIGEYVSNADIYATKGQFRFGSGPKKVISALHQSATFGATQHKARAMKNPRTLAICFFLSALFFAPAAGATECRDEMEVFAGTLWFVRTQHALNKTPIEAWRVTLNPPACILYKDSVNAKEKSHLDNVATIHLLVTPSEAARLKGRSGARVAVKAGKDGGVSPALTAWHIGDVIMIHPEIVSVGGKPLR
jgi:hypothetical protein